MWRVRREKCPDNLGQEQRKTPTLRAIEQAAVLWRPALPTLPDGGLITATARSPDPCIVPAYVDTMENAKLCISLALSVPLLFAYSICHAPFTVLSKGLGLGLGLASMLVHIVLKRYRSSPKNSLLYLRNPFFHEFHKSLSCFVPKAEAELQKIRGDNLWSMVLSPHSSP